MDNTSIPPNAEQIAQNRISFGRKMGFGKDLIISLIVNAIMNSYAPFTATTDDYEAVQAWAANHYEE